MMDRMAERAADRLEQALDAALTGLAGEWPAPRVTPSPGSYQRAPGPEGGAGYRRMPRPGREVRDLPRGAWWIGASKLPAPGRDPAAGRAAGVPGPGRTDGGDDHGTVGETAVHDSVGPGAAGDMHVVPPRAGVRVPGMRPASLRVPRRG